MIEIWNYISSGFPRVIANQIIISSIQVLEFSYNAPLITKDNDEF